MEKGLERFLKKMVTDKFPQYLDVYTNKRMGWDVARDQPKDLFEIFLITKIYDPVLYDVVEKYVYDLAKYMDIKVLAVYNEVVTDEKWEDIKSGKRN